MTPATTLEPQPWMTAPATCRIVAALCGGGADAVRFVGGCVRDALAGRKVKDVDMATPLPPERVMALLESAGIRAVPTGLSHGTVTAVEKGQPFEITTLRRDVETDGRRAKVAFTDDWIADAARRDFTINAMSCSPDGMVYDPFGGLADLAAGVVRFVGDPEDRIREDVLRLLRFFRFHAHFGQGRPDAFGLDACIALAPQLTTLSAERVRVELLRLLEARSAASVLRLMHDAGILGVVLPEALRFDRLAGLIALEDRLGMEDAVRRLAAVLQCDQTDVWTFAARLRLSNGERARLTEIARGGDLGDDERAMRRALYHLGPERFRDLVLLVAAEGGAEDLLQRRLKEAKRWTAKRLPVTGADVMAQGVPRGPDVGRHLAAVEAWWIAEDFAPDRKACLERLRQLGANPDAERRTDP